VPVASVAPPHVPDPAPAALWEAPRGFYAGLRFIAQMRSMFLVCEGDDGLYILDQHAAAERVTFHRLRSGYLGKGVAMQRMLLPEVVELSAAEVALLEERADEITTIGLELRRAGPAAVAVHAVPQLLPRASPARLVRDLLDELALPPGGGPHDAARSFGNAVDLVLATMACHGSIRAGDRVSADEASALLRALDAVDFAGHCPHGRPVVTRLSFSELERRVGR